MARRYYSSRNRPQSLDVEGLYWKLKNLFLFFRDRDFFKGKADISQSDIPNKIFHKAAIQLRFQPFPITEWTIDKITEDNIFDTIEFLFDHVSRPENWSGMTSETGWNYYDYANYDDQAGQDEFRNTANDFLCDYKKGYELSKDGTILTLGSEGLQYIFDAEIIPYDDKNVDSKVRNAITKWRNRHLSITDRKEAIRELADVFEWLKKTKRLSSVLDSKDESAIFELANSFGIRHHNPKQKTNYDQGIWYSWMFHYYLATYHAVIRLLIKKGNA